MISKQNDASEHHKASQLEDRVLKTAAQFFGEDLLPYLGVKEKVASIAPTEHIHLELRRLEEDFNFIMRNGSWLHLEFESDSITIKDLRRFREYEAYIGFACDVPVSTMVICSSGAQTLKCELVNGPSIFRVSLIRLKDRKAEQVFEKLDRKLDRKLERKSKKEKRIKRYDLVPLLLTPLMSGKMDMLERFRKIFDILSLEELSLSREERRRMQAAVYALAVKFLDQEQLEKIKERIGMTILGQMLWDGGLERGLERGREQGQELGETRMSHLNIILIENNRYEDLKQASQDREYREKLYKEFGL